MKWNWQRQRDKQVKRDRQSDRRVLCLSSSSSSCRGDRPGLAWLDARVWEEKTKKRKKSATINETLFVLVGTPFYPWRHTHTCTHTHSVTHTDRGTGWLNRCAIVCVCLCVWLPLPLCVCDWLYLRQGPFCFKPENGSETEAGPVIGLLRPCLAWEKPSLAR